MRGSLIALSLVLPSVAVAQPAARTPDGQPTVLGTWNSKLWPPTVSLEQVRTLRPCGPADPMPAPGAALPCLPPIVPDGVQWAFGLDWTTGLAFGTPATEGIGQGLGAQLDFALSPRVQLGVRYELMGVGLPTAHAGDPTTALAQHMLAQLRYRAFTDEVGRDAFTFTAGAGLAVQDDVLGGMSPMMRVAIAREIGSYLTDTGAVGAALELAYERTLDADAAQMVLASVRFGWEVNIREPANLGTAGSSSWRHDSSADIYLGPWFGLGYTLGLPIVGPLSLSTTASALFGFSAAGSEGTEHGFDGTTLAIQSGPRLTFDAPIYVQAQIGPGWIGGDPQRALDPLVDAELGFHFDAGCTGNADLGFRLRADVADGLDIVSGALVMRVAFSDALSRHDHQTCGHTEVALWTAGAPAPPPPPVVVVTPQPPPPVVVAPLPPPVVVVAPVAPEPIVITVDLGAQLFGGAIQIRIDPRLLPLARLRGAGFVQVELSGDASALAAYDASLRATLGRERIRVDAWTQTVTDSSVVRATFTVWPPGTDP